MGPPPFGDGNVVSALPRPLRDSSFNGATAFRRWKRDYAAINAWMRYRPFNGATAFRRWKLVVVGAGVCAFVLPSMGPPPFGDGNLRSLYLVSASRTTFNGATAFRRWKLGSSGNSFGRGCRLQWGHRFSAMETRTTFTASATPAFLQWGHRLSAMETRKSVNCGISGLILQWGHRLSAMETSSLYTKDDLQVDLQWGHRLSAMETGLVDFTAKRGAKPSMGPPPFGDGNSLLSTLTTATTTTFNGATAFRRWKQPLPALTRAR